MFKVNPITRLALKILKLSIPFLDRFIFNFSDRDISKEVIFILGVPRSGSTYLYQQLTNTTRYDYIDNLTNYLCDKSFRTAVTVSTYLRGDKPHNCFKSIYGNTDSCGMHAPSEGGKYFQSQRNNEYDDIADDLLDIRTKINKPFIIKNLYVGLQLDKILNAVANVKFIHIIRNKEDNIKSLIKARLDLGILPDQPWSAFPEVEFSCRNERELLEFQYDTINNSIANQLLKSNNYLPVDFEKFKQDTANELLKIEAFINE